MFDNYNILQELQEGVVPHNHYYFAMDRSEYLPVANNVNPSANFFAFSAAARKIKAPFEGYSRKYLKTIWVNNENSDFNRAKFYDSILPRFNSRVIDLEKIKISLQQNFPMRSNQYSRIIRPNSSLRLSLSTPNQFKVIVGSDEYYYVKTNRSGLYYKKKKETSFALNNAIIQVPYMMTFKTEYLGDLQEALFKQTPLRTEWFTIFMERDIPGFSTAKGYTDNFDKEFISPYELAGIEIIIENNFIEKLSMPVSRDSYKAIEGSPAELSSAVLKYNNIILSKPRSQKEVYKQTVIQDFFKTVKTRAEKKFDERIGLYYKPTWQILETNAEFTAKLTRVVKTVYEYLKSEVKTIYIYIDRNYYEYLVKNNGSLRYIRTISEQAYLEENSTRNNDDTVLEVPTLIITSLNSLENLIYSKTSEIIPTILSNGNIFVSTNKSRASNNVILLPRNSVGYSTLNGVISLVKKQVVKVENATYKGFTQELPEEVFITCHRNTVITRSQDRVFWLDATINSNGISSTSQTNIAKIDISSLGDVMENVGTYSIFYKTLENFRETVKNQTIPEYSIVGLVEFGNYFIYVDGGLIRIEGHINALANVLRKGTINVQFPEARSSFEFIRKLVTEVPFDARKKILRKLKTLSVDYLGDTVLKINRYLENTYLNSYNTTSTVETVPLPPGGEGPVQELTVSDLDAIITELSSNTGVQIVQHTVDSGGGILSSIVVDSVQSETTPTSQDEPF